MSSATQNHAARELERYNRRRAQGLCGGCGKVAPEEGFARCDDCLARIRRSRANPTRKNIMNPADR